MSKTMNSLYNEYYALELELQKTESMLFGIVNSSGRFLASFDVRGNHYNERETLINSIRLLKKKLKKRRQEANN